jgi:hypothetical protein
MFPSNFIKELSGDSDELGISQDDQLSKSSKDVHPNEQKKEGQTSGLCLSFPSVLWPILKGYDKCLQILTH